MIDCEEYIGVDVSDTLIDKMKKMHEDEKHKFICMDGCSEKLPEGDILLIKEVFQHLPISSIKRCIDINFNRYKCIIVTESRMCRHRITNPNMGDNVMKDGREFDGQGIVLTAPPFNLNNAIDICIIPKDFLRNEFVMTLVVNI